MLQKSKQTIRLIAILICLFSIAVNAQEFLTPTVNIKGKVSKIYEIEYQVTERLSAFTFKKEQFVRGNISKLSPNKQYQEYSSYYNEKTILMDMYFTIDSQNKFTAGEMFGMKSDKTSDVKFTYNKNNKLERLQLISLKENKTYRDYKFDYEKGALVKTTLEEYQRGEDKPYIYEYDFEKGLMKTVRKINNDGQLFSTKKIELNEEGDPETIKEYAEDGTLIDIERYEYQYDDKGNYTACLIIDYREDVMTLLQRKIIYKDAKPKKKLSEKDLEGFWVSWGKEMIVEFKSDGKSIVRTKEKRREIENRYTYSPFSEEMTLGVYPNSRDNFSVEFDGQILSLFGKDQHDPILHLERMEVPKTSKEYIAKLHGVDLSGSFGSSGLKTNAGKEIYPENYFVSPLTDKCLSINNGKKYAIGDYKGKLKTKFIYDNLRKLDSKYIRAQNDRKYGVVDAKGKVIVPLEYGRLVSGGEGFFWAYENAGASHNPILMKPDGSAPVQYKDIRPLKFNRRLAKKSSFGPDADWLDQNYNKVKTVQKVTYAQPISFNRFKAKTESGVEVIDSMGASIFPLITEDISPLNGRLFKITENKKHGLLEADGTPLTKVVYDNLLNPHIYEKGISGIEIRRQKAALLYRKGDELGLLTGLGKEQAFSLPSLVDNEYFYKKLTDGKSFELKYSFYWEPGNGIGLKYKGMDYVEASFDYNLLPLQDRSFETAVQSACSHYNLTGSRISKQIDGHDAYSVLTHLPAPQGRNNFIQKDIFIKVDDSQYLHFTFRSGNDQLIFLAYELFILEETIRILGK